MAHGVQIFDASGNIILDLSNTVALYHSSTTVSGGGTPTLSKPSAASNYGAIVWPTNGHEIAYIMVPDDNGNPNALPVLGAWKHVATYSGNNVTLSYPSYRAEYFTGYVFTYPASSVQNLSSAIVDMWIN